MIPEPRTENHPEGTRPRTDCVIRHYSISLILLLALLLRLLLWSQPLHQPANDEVEYITVARDLLAGRGWQFYEHYRWLRAPLYPLFLAGSLWLAGGDLHLAALPNIALSAANVYLIYRLALALVGLRAARVAALLAALLWTQATFASLYMSETLFTFLFTGALVCLVRRPPNDYRPQTIQGNLAAGGYGGAALQVSLIGAGVLFGLATLTRSVTLVFLPVAALWLLVRRPMIDDRRPPTDDDTDTPPASRLSPPASRLSPLASRLSVLCALLFVLCSLLTIAPWTIRNYRAYGRPILVETGLSFNLWFFYEPRESNNEIYRALERIPNPAERSDYATAKGLARLREDPAILLRNVGPNLVALLSADTTEDRFLQESYYADVGLPLFAAALLFDDALYPLILLAAVAGLALRRRHVGSGQAAARFGDPKWLIIAWTLYVVLTVLLTHSETRYRHFLFPVLIPYAAWMLASRPADQEIRRQATGDERQAMLGLPSSLFPLPSSLSPLLVVAVLWGLMLGVALGSYPWGWAGQSLARGWHTAAGDLAWAAGDAGAALRAYERAGEVQETPDVWLRRGDAARVLGDTAAALRAYRVAARLTPPYIAASARLGDLLRELGDDAAARDAFKGEFADLQKAVDWSWRELRPAPRPFLDIGGGLDFGYVGGVYPAEDIQGETARWTKGNGMLRLGGGPHGRSGGGPTLEVVRLRMAAPRPDGARVRAEVCAADSCHTLDVAPTWRDYDLLFRAARGAPLYLEIQSGVFRPSDYDPASPDDRALGVLLSRTSVSEIDAPPRMLVGWGSIARPA